MPELPEVEVIRRGLAPLLVGRRITRVIACNRRLRQSVPRSRLKRMVEGSRVAAVDRRAKYLLVSMSSGAVLVLHLGMSGRLAFSANGSPRVAHDQVRFLLDSGLELRFNDVRRFGSVQVFREGEELATALFARLGPEPLSADFSGTYLRQEACGRTRPVKNFLMDARVVAGIGNIYASEILFAAGIRPTRAAGTLDLPAWSRVVRACRKVLLQAISAGGTTIAHFVDSSGQAGYFQNQLQVYGRQGQRCYSCGSSVIRQTLAGRATYYCPRCQR